MSWFFGYYRFSQNVQETINVPPALRPYRHIENSRFAMYQDTKSKLNFSAGSEKKGWLVSGFGINTEGEKFTIISGSEWQNAKGEKPFLHYEGQYVSIEWDDDSVRINTDKTGLRKLFYFHDKVKNILFFSTRLDILVSVLDTSAINFEALGSFYSIIFSLRQHETFINNVHTTGPSTSIIISPDNFQLDKKQWILNEGESEDIPQLITQYLLAPHNSGYKTILSLSGGLDSRTLLAIYQHSRIPDFSAYCAGSAYLPDLLIAHELCAKENIPLETFVFDLSTVPDIYNFLQEVSLRTNMIFKLVNALFFWGLKTHDTRNAFLIDGAFGEFLRCMLGNKLLIFGKKRLLQNDTTIFTDVLTKSRPGFFSQDVVNQFNKGIVEDCQNVFINMPPVTAKNIEYWINLFIVHYRLGLENSGYIDSIVPNIMPFTQDKLLRAMFQMPRRSRENNKTNLHIISQNCSRLQKIPLVRDDQRIPFFTSYKNTLSAVYSLVQKKLFRHFKEDIHIKMIGAMKNPIMSKIRSQAVRECGYYNTKHLEALTNDIYNHKNMTHALELLDFLNIDFWREHCRQKDLII